MTTLKDILNQDFGLEGLEADPDPGTEVKIEELKLGELGLSEEAQGKVKAELDKRGGIIGKLTGKVSEQDVAMKVYEANFDKLTKGEKIETKIEKEGGEKGKKTVMGVELEEGDKLAPVLEAIEKKFTGIESSFEKAGESEFVTEVQALAKVHDDMKEIAPVMDKLIERYPDLKKIPMEMLYRTAKGVHTDKKTKEEEGQTFYDRTADAARKGSETTGTSTDLTQTGDAKTIEEAFDKATSQISKTKK